jgi:ribosome-binding protein aMBF1 (putative translation factor)
MQFDDILNDLLRDPEFRERHARKDAADLAARVSDQIVRARIRVGMTQADLARKAGTQQSGIARAESGATLPSLAFLQRLAEAMGTHLVEPRFVDVRAVLPKRVSRAGTTQSRLGPARDPNHASTPFTFTHA